MSESAGEIHSSLHLIAEPSAPLDQAVWDAATSLDTFIGRVEKYPELWRSSRRISRIDDEAHGAVAALTAPIRLLVMMEDWCGDAIHTIPFVARLTEANPLLELRVTSRDQNDAMMDAHRSGGSRSIPVLMAFDDAGLERGWWGPRPTPLHQWVKSEGLAIESKERYKLIRTYYARDRGLTTVREILDLLHHAATPR